MEHAAAVAAIAILGLAAYASSFHGAFQFDDVASIVENPTVHGLGQFFAGKYPRPSRIVGYFTLALNYELGGLDPTGYHVVNLCVHLLNAVLLYALVVLAFATPRLKGSALAPWARTIGLVAALLFVAHPIQTQAVTYVVQRLASLATTFYLLTLVLYVRWRLGTVPGATSARRIAAYVPILVTALLAMKTKEIAFTLPFVAAISEVLLFDGRASRRLLFLAPLLATLAVIPFTMLSTASAVGQSLSDVTAMTKVQTSISRAAYLRTELPVIVSYLRLLVVPVGQNVDHDVPIEESLGWNVVASAGLLLALLALALWLWRASSSGRTRLDPSVRLVSLGILWFFLALSVESSVIPIVDVMYEHRVYLPSAGFFVAVATAWLLLARRLFAARPQRSALAIAGAVAVVLAVATFGRNQVWADELSLWSDAVAKSPGKSRPHNNVGAALEERGRFGEAEEQFAAAARLDPDNAEAYYNLGRLKVTAGRYEEGVALLRKSIELQPGSARAYANLGAALNKLGRYRETVELLERAGDVVAESAEAHFNLGVAYVAAGQAGQAAREIAVLRELSPPLAAQLQSFAGGH